MKTGSEFHVGIVGLGSMGMGAALSCVRAGLSTWGADLNSNACATLKEAGACGVSDNAATFAEKLDALLVLVVNAAQVKQVLFGETGVAQHLKPGTAVMVSSTIASADAQEIATALAGFDLEMLDAPVSGGAVKAANGEMTVMAKGAENEEWYIPEIKWELVLIYGVTAEEINDERNAAFMHYKIALMREIKLKN